MNCTCRKHAVNPFCPRHGTLRESSRIDRGGQNPGEPSGVPRYQSAAALSERPGQGHSSPLPPRPLRFLHGLERVRELPLDTTELERRIVEAYQ